MSGYRNLHRERVNGEAETPIWQVQSSPLSSVAARSPTLQNNPAPYCVWTASADGCVRAYRVQEKEVQEELNAAALTLTLTHALVGPSQVYPPPEETTLLGCSQVSVCRNYVGDDDMAGDFVVASLDMVGRIRIWAFSMEDIDHPTDPDSSPPKQIKAAHEFLVENATGTILALCPPKLSGQGDVVVAVACLDGSVAMVATGGATPNAKKEPSPAGTILDRWGSGSIVLSLSWHPTQHTLAVGRKDGIVDIIPAAKQGTHRLSRHTGPVRASTFTNDGQLLVTGSDEGLLCVWDINRKVPTLVHHVVHAHSTWILSVSVLKDSRRFVTCGADHKLHVWDVGQIYTPLHTFHCDHVIWTIHVTPHLQPQRLVCGSDKGWLQVFSLEA